MMAVISEGWDPSHCLAVSFVSFYAVWCFYDEHETNKAMIPKTKQNVSKREKSREQHCPAPGSAGPVSSPTGSPPSSPPRGPTQPLTEFWQLLTCELLNCPEREGQAPKAQGSLVPPPSACVCDGNRARDGPCTFCWRALGCVGVCLGSDVTVFLSVPRKV